jgi:cytochrome c oxidase cbb3-type subunit III
VLKTVLMLACTTALLAQPETAFERGKKQFSAACGFCHGATAKGGDGGPDLIRSEVVLDDEKGNRIGPVIRGGRPDKGMPAFDLTNDQIQDIAAFLAGSIKQAMDRGKYEILNIVTGDAKAGQAYFNGAGKCGACHSVTGDLKGLAGKYDPVTIQGKFLMPRTARGYDAKGKGATRATVTAPGAKPVEGRVVRIDDFFISIETREGEYLSFTRRGDVPKVEVRDPLQAHYDMLTKYTDRDMHNLTAYLVTLK